MARPYKKRVSKKTSIASVQDTKEAPEFAAPVFAHEAKARDNRSRSFIEDGHVASGLSDFPNIRRSKRPFVTSSDHSCMDTRQAVSDCVDAYWAFPMLRNTVEVMVELANSKMFLTGGNKASRDFVTAWLGKINAPTLASEFFREWWRSGNGFLFRIDGKFSDTELTKMKQVFGASKTEIPVGYIILNPEAITASGDILFGKPEYYKIVTPYEAKRFQNPKTDSEKSFIRKSANEFVVDVTASKETRIKLDDEQLTVVLYNAQSYEPMGVPMAYGVLKDIEAKMELKRIDLSIARTTDRAMLHIMVGETPTQYSTTPFNQKTIESLQTLFAQETIARTLITDYTVKAEWLIPDIQKILGAAKYEQIDKDISSGLNAFLFSEGEKFANTSIKVEVFVKRLKAARNAFVNNFLQPEIIRVCKAIGSRVFPTINFEEISLKDELQYAKLVMSMFQLGALTPQEMNEAMETGKLPSNEESLEAQRLFKQYRDEGLYMPIVGGSTQLQAEQLKLQDKQVEYQYEVQTKQAETQRQAANNKVTATKSVSGKPVAKKAPGKAGRPQGTKAPQTTKTARASEGFSLSALKDTFYAVSELQNSVDRKLRKQFKIKELDEAQAKISKSLVSAIISNEPKDNWKASIESYVTAPKDISPEILDEIDSLSIAHNVDEYSAAILRLTKRDAPEEEETEE